MYAPFYQTGTVPIKLISISFRTRNVHSKALTVKRFTMDVNFVLLFARFDLLEIYCMKDTETYSLRIKYPTVH